MFEESLLAPKFPFDIDIDNLIISTKLFMKKQNKKSVTEPTLVATYRSTHYGPWLCT